MIKIAHFADTHIRNLKFHDEYRFVFNQIYKKLLSQKPDYIVHCGDLVAGVFDIFFVSFKISSFRRLDCAKSDGRTI